MGLERENSSSRSRSGKRTSIGRTSTTSRGERRSSEKSEARHRYALCVRNDDYAASLEVRKLYEVVDDSFAAQHGMLRVIDESGEDYLYPDEFFVAIELPLSVELALARTA